MIYRFFAFMTLFCITNSSFCSLFAVPERDLLITGCARSGTAYVSQVLNACKLNVGHETDGAYGISSWVMAIPADQTPWGPARNNYSFRHVFHQVRDPLKTISSVFTTEGTKSWAFITMHIPQISLADLHIIRAAKYWYYWNLQAEAAAEWTYRLEDLDNLREEFERRLGVQLDSQKWGSIAKNANPRHLKPPRAGYIQTDKPTEFTWDDLERELPLELFHKIQLLAQKYGYR